MPGAETPHMAIEGSGHPDPSALIFGCTGFHTLPGARSGIRRNQSKGYPDFSMSPSPGLSVALDLLAMTVADFRAHSSDYFTLCAF